jgi:HD superfamily phosphohydrolase
MAHCFEELILTDASAEKLRNDKIVIRMLQGDLPSVVLPAELSELQDCLNLWGLEVEDVVAVISGHRNLSKLNGDVVGVLHSILDGPLGADILDSVQRDSLHTGNPAGRAVDEDGLIDSLVLRSCREGLGIHEKGLHASQSVFDARSRMFTSVYWHRLIRSANRMFTEAVTILLQNNPIFQSAFEADFFYLDDEAMLRFVAQHIAQREAQYLIAPLRSISGRRSEIYRRVITISAPPRSIDLLALRRHATEAHGQICQMYDWYLEGNSAAPKWRTFRSETREHILRVAGLSLPQYEVLVDVPDIRFRLPIHDDEAASSYLVHGHGPPVAVRLKDPLFGANIDNWRMNARRVRIFTSPKVAEALMGREDRLANDIRDLATQIFTAPV